MVRKKWWKSISAEGLGRVLQWPCGESTGGAKTEKGKT